MAKNGFKIIDSELHLEEPFDLWEKRLPETYRSRTKLVEPPGGHLDTDQDEIQLGDRVAPRRSRAERPSGDDEKASLVFRQGNRRWENSPRQLLEARTNCSPTTYIDGMNTEGIDVAILTPSLGFHIMNIDGVEPGHALALCRAYNDYAAEFASENPGRFKFWGWLPRQAPDLAAEEARRCVEDLGAVGVAMTHAGVDGTILTDESFEPLWGEINRLNTSLGLHVTGITALDDDVAARYSGHRRTEVVSSTMSHPFYAQACLTELILGGVLEQYVNMKVVIMESNVTWLPWLLWRMDEKWETYGPDQEYTLSLKPSEYFKRQCYAVVDPSEGVAKYAIDYVGADRLLWSSDFPHHDSPFPEASNHFLALADITDEAKRAILWDNGAKLYGLGA